MPALPGDSRSAWDRHDRHILQDRRVTQLWDAHDVLGTWLSAHGGSFWDTFLLYGPKSRWDDRPTKPLASGSPIIGATDVLGREASQLLRD
jgi:hypothetical protein